MERTCGAKAAATRRANASEKPLLHLGHNLWLSHFIGGFHRYNTYADLVSLHPLFSSPFASPGPNIRIVSASPMHAITSS
jgi:hypothetical protein